MHLSNKKFLVLTSAIFIAFAVFFFLASYNKKMRLLVESLQVDTVPTGIINYGPMGKILKQLGRLRVRENDNQRFAQTSNFNKDITILPFQKRRQVDDYLFSANKLALPGFTSSRAISSVTPKKGWPVLSITLDEKDLYDPDRGILTNSEKNGRDWERIGEVSFSQNGQILFATNAGIRVHGGIRLKTKKWKNGFKIYFRNVYGIPQVNHSMILPDNEVPLQTMVVQTTAWPSGYPLNNPLAYDIARQIGCVVPQTQLVEIYVNGQPYSMGYITEHLSRRQWGQRYHGDKYSFFKFRANNSAEDFLFFKTTTTSVLDDGKELTEEHVSKFIDIDNLIRYSFALVFSGVTDGCQGVATTNPSKPDNRMLFISWDMDHAFYDYRAVTVCRTRPNWSQESFSLLFNNTRDCPQSAILTRLIYEDAEFRDKYIQRIVEILNHRLTRKFLHERVEYYKQMLENYGEPHSEYIAILKEFMKNRPDFIRQELSSLFALSSSFQCEVEAPIGTKLTIDGYPYTTYYSGFYFSSLPIRVNIADSAAGHLDHWLVNGQRVDSPELTYFPTEKTTIRAVLHANR